ncbi:hypothetical protein [Heyndrickxia acidiproducens]|uniref:hypothetical protein n=1 Tax=Heyndrickxia acidiproducens TaxID=1121084 RepID=UPI0003607B60|nr:hypothetical protein [Heyndrickxia acidiproducens]
MAVFNFKKIRRDFALHPGAAVLGRQEFLRKHRYPPNIEPKAVEDVLEQAKQQAANM